MSTIDVSSPTLPTPPDFPVRWESPEQERLFWPRERMHWPNQIYPLEAAVLAAVDKGFNSMAAASDMPIRFISRRINTYVYQATAPLMLALFLLVLLLPLRFSLGGLALTPIRVLLLLAAVPLLVRWLSGAAGRVTAGDVLIGLHCLWVALALVVLHGTERIPYAGITVIEIFASYLLGRLLIRNAADYRLFFRYFLIALLLLAPFVAVEMATGKLVLSQVLDKLADTHPKLQTDADQMRMGFYRAQGVLEHPILWGVFCSMGIANVFYIHRQRLFRSAVLTGFVTIALVGSERPFLESLAASAPVQREHPEIPPALPVVVVDGHSHDGNRIVDRHDLALHPESFVGTGSGRIPEVLDRRDALDGARPGRRRVRRGLTEELAERIGPRRTPRVLVARDPVGHGRPVGHRAMLADARHPSLVRSRRGGGMSATSGHDVIGPRGSKGACDEQLRGELHTVGG